MDIDQKNHIENLIATGEFRGQKHQDKWVLLHALPLRRGGYFLDLAAADGLTHSNSYVLEKHFEWSGLCIEPNPFFYEQLKQNRVCVTDPSVISDKEEIIEFRIDNGQLGGIVADDTDNNSRIRTDELERATILKVQSSTINDVLARNNAPETIDYFSLDVEGSEERIISTLDFDTYGFKCITIERPTPRVNEILFDNGYIFVRNIQFDSFYVHPKVLHESNLACETFEQVPPKNW